jgi:hypothetical protein
MKKAHRAIVAACAAVATLVFASAAFATYAPKLVVSSTGPGGTTRVGVVVGASDDATAKTTIYVPNGYTVGTPAVGTTLGDVTATAAAADLGGAVLPLTGTLQVIAPNATTIADAQNCQVTPTQTWDLHLSAAGQTLDIPLFVVAPVAPEAAVGYNNKLVVCLPPPDVPTGTPGRATFGAKLLSATFSVSAITEPTAAADYRWTSLWTPYTPGNGKVNAAGSVEVQALRHVPIALKVTATKKKKTTTKTVKVKGKKKKVKVVSTIVKVVSSVSENGQPGSAVITTTTAGKKVGSAGILLAHGKSAKVVVSAKIDSTSSVPTGTPTAATDLFYRDLGPGSCVATPIFQGLPCNDATVGGETLTKTVTVKGF